MPEAPARKRIAELYFNGLLDGYSLSMVEEMRKKFDSLSPNTRPWMRQSYENLVLEAERKFVARHMAEKALKEARGDLSKVGEARHRLMEYVRSAMLSRLEIESLNRQVLALEEEAASAGEKRHAEFAAMAKKAAEESSKAALKNFVDFANKNFLADVNDERVRDGGNLLEALKTDFKPADLRKAEAILESAKAVLEIRSFTRESVVRGRDPAALEEFERKVQEYNRKHVESFKNKHGMENPLAVHSSHFMKILNSAKLLMGIEKPEEKE
jgi:hypothetical protein